MKNFKHIAIIVTGGKGGIGKTFMSRVLCELYEQHNRPYWLLDADRESPTCGLTYLPDIYTKIKQGKLSKPEADYPLTEQLVFTDDPTRAARVDSILELVQSRDTLIVTPANVSAEVDAWIAESDLKSINEDTLDSRLFVKLFVIGGVPESAALLEESLKTGVPHIVALNRGTLDAGWNLLDQSSSFAELLTDPMVNVIDLANLNDGPGDKSRKGYLAIDPSDAATISNENIKFSDAIAADRIKEGTRRRLKKWLSEMSALFLRDPLLAEVFEA